MAQCLGGPGRAAAAVGGAAAARDSGAASRTALARQGAGDLAPAGLHLLLNAIGVSKMCGALVLQVRKVLTATFINRASSDGSANGVVLLLEALAAVLEGSLEQMQRVGLYKALAVCIDAVDVEKLASVVPRDGRHVHDVIADLDNARTRACRKGGGTHVGIAGLLLRVLCTASKAMAGDSESVRASLTYLARPQCAAATDGAGAGAAAAGTSKRGGGSDVSTHVHTRRLDAAIDHLSWEVRKMVRAAECARVESGGAGASADRCPPLSELPDVSGSSNLKVGYVGGWLVHRCLEKAQRGDGDPLLVRHLRCLVVPAAGAAGPLDARVPPGPAAAAVVPSVASSPATAATTPAAPRFLRRVLVKSASKLMDRGQLTHCTAEAIEFVEGLERVAHHVLSVQRFVLLGPEVRDKGIEQARSHSDLLRLLRFATAAAGGAAGSPGGAPPAAAGAGAAAGAPATAASDGTAAVLQRALDALADRYFDMRTPGAIRDAMEEHINARAVEEKARRARAGQSVGGSSAGATHDASGQPRQGPHPAQAR